MQSAWQGGFKPLDFGGDGVTGSVDAYGRIIALNCYHPRHGYMTLSSAPPFPESERYNPAAVRAYRFGLRHWKASASSLILGSSAVPSCWSEERFLS
jgi:hypothetical protein